MEPSKCIAFRIYAYNIMNSMTGTKSRYQSFSSRTFNKLLLIQYMENREFYCRMKTTIILYVF